MEFGNLFLKYKMTIPKTAMFTVTNGNAQKPIENGSTSRRTISSSLRSLSVESLDAIKAGNTTETRLIKTTDKENRNTAQLRGLFLVITFFSEELGSVELVFS